MIEPLSAALDAGVTAPDDLSTLPGLTITADPQTRDCRLRLVGRLDAETVPLFAACLTSWADRGHPNMVIDLTQVSHVDTAGAAALAHATHVLRRIGGRAQVLATAELLAGPLAARGLDLVIATQPTTGDRRVR